MTFEDYDQLRHKSEVENLRELLFVTVGALSVTVLLVFVLIVFIWWIKR
jgi:hypothetical protein